MLCEAQHTLFGAIRMMLTLMGPWILNINKRKLVLARLCPLDSAHLHSQRSSSNKTLWPFQTSQLNDSVRNSLLFWAGLLLLLFFPRAAHVSVWQRLCAKCSRLLSPSIPSHICFSKLEHPLLHPPTPHSLNVSFQALCPLLYFWSVFVIFSFFEIFFCSLSIRVRVGCVAMQTFLTRLIIKAPRAEAECHAKIATFTFDWHVIWEVNAKRCLAALVADLCFHACASAPCCVSTQLMLRSNW